MSDGFFIAEFVAPLLNFTQNAFGVTTKKLEAEAPSCIFFMVRLMRLELIRPFEHCPLKAACLPIPPQPRGDKIYGAVDET